MRFFCISVVLGATLLASVYLTTAQAQACDPRFYGGPVYYSAGPVGYYQPGMPAYYWPPQAYPPPYAPGYAARRPGAVATIGAYDDYFEPQTLNVPPGTVVRWVNYGKHVHTATSNDGRWDSGDVPPGAAYSVTFRTPGTYYYCRHHTKEKMQGTIVVGRGDAEPSGGYGARKPSSPDTADLIKHGDYLVNQVAHCSHCHSPQDDKGQPDRARLLRGATLPIRPKKETKNWADESPNLTRSGLSGKWSEDEMIKFLTTGINPEGEMPTPPMPVFHLNTTDARAVYLYLKSLPSSKESGDSEKKRKYPE